MLGKKLGAHILLVLIVSTFVIVEAKNWTVDQRQQQLMKDINAGQKAKELTVKEAKKLRSELADIARLKTRMKSKSAIRALDSEENNKLEAKLNDISVKIKKLKLEKRIQAN